MAAHFTQNGLLTRALGLTDNNHQGGAFAIGMLQTSSEAAPINAHFNDDVPLAQSVCNLKSGRGIGLGDRDQIDIGAVERCKLSPWSSRRATRSSP